MLRTLLYEICSIITIHWNDNLFSWWLFGSHLNSWFRFEATFDDILNLVDFLCTKSRKCVFDLDDFYYMRSQFRSLCIRFMSRLDNRSWFKVLEIFGNLVNFFLELGRNRRGNSFNTCWNQFALIRIVSTGNGFHLRSEFCWNLLS